MIEVPTNSRLKKKTNLRQRFIHKMFITQEKKSDNHDSKNSFLKRKIDVRT
jgi:hypothetical protein